MKFSEIHLHPLLQANLDKINFLECTPIQEEAIPLLRKGKDLSGLAQTGTGKTGAFLIPLIDRILKSEQAATAPADSETIAFPEWRRRQYILVLVPTRELAEQVHENAKTLLEGTGMSCVSVYGGTTYEKQISALKQGVEIVIATPGRFIDLYKEHVADLGLVRAVVFDEADRMFDMGFRDDMKFILKRLPRDRQFLVFSATLNFEVLNVAYENGAEPVEINISRDQAKAENVKDFMIHLGHDEKPSYLLSLLKKHEPRQAIIFSNFKHNVDRIARFLSNNGVPAMGISSLLTQGQRNRVMALFKAENEKNILVATDVAARGLDILGVDMVLNFDLPDDPENYVHRIGRTGRAGMTGQAFSMVSDRDVDALQRIEDFLGNKLEVIWLDDGELVKDYKPFPRDEGRFRGAPSQGRGRPEGRGERPGRPSSGGGGGGQRPRPQGRSGGGHGGGDRDRGGDRGGGPRHESHRDRNLGRHREQSGRHQATGNSEGGQGQQRSNSQQQQGQNSGRRDGRPQHQRGGQQQGGGGPNRGRSNHPRHDSRRPQAQRHGHHQGGRPQGPRANPPAAMAASQSIGKKVSGFFKKIFGKES